MRPVSSPLLVVSDSHANSTVDCVLEDPPFLDTPRYLDKVFSLSIHMNALLDLAQSSKFRTWFQQPFRIVCVPGTRLPFSVNMHDEGLLELWRQHGGIEDRPTPKEDG